MKQPPAPKAKPTPSKADLLNDLFVDLQLTPEDISASVARAEARNKADKAGKPKITKAKAALYHSRRHSKELKRMASILNALDADKERLATLNLGEWTRTKLVMKVTTSRCLGCHATVTYPQGLDPIMLERQRVTPKGIEAWLTPALPYTDANLQRVLDTTHTTTLQCPECFYTTAEEEADKAKAQQELFL